MEEKQQEYQEPIQEQPISPEQEPQIEKGVPTLEKEQVLDSDKEKKLEAEPVEKEQKTKEIIERESSPAPSAPSGKVQQQVKQLKDTNKENQVKALRDLAFQKGVDFAIEVAKNLDNAYVLDEFHDSLIDELREKLIEKGNL